MLAMSHTYDAVRAITDAVLASQCSARVSSTIIAAAVRAAAAMDGNKCNGQVPEHLADDVEATVSDRLNVLRPVLTAQATQGLATGQDCHSPAGLTKQENIIKANVARHAGFGNPRLVSEMTKQEIRSIQRSSKKKAAPPRAPSPPPDPLGGIVGTWQSAENKIVVLNSDAGVCARFDDCKNLQLFSVVDEVIQINGWTLTERQEEQLQWEQGHGEEHKTLTWDKCSQG